MEVVVLSKISPFFFATPRCNVVTSPSWALSYIDWQYLHSVKTARFPFYLQSPDYETFVVAFSVTVRC